MTQHQYSEPVRWIYKVQHTQHVTAATVITTLSLTRAPTKIPIITSWWVSNSGWRDTRRVVAAIRLCRLTPAVCTPATAPPAARKIIL